MLPRKCHSSCFHPHWASVGVRTRHSAVMGHHTRCPPLRARPDTVYRREGDRGLGQSEWVKVTSELLAKGQPVLMALFITFILLFFFFPVKAREERNCRSKPLMSSPNKPLINWPPCSLMPGSLM